jgi:hypothetical protein
MYLIALLCPPLALVLIGRPVRAVAATAILGVALAIWPSTAALILAALTILWACQAVGDSRAKRELDSFLESFESNPKARVS